MAEGPDGLTTFRNRTWGTEYFVPVRVRRTVELDSPDTGHDLRWRFEGIVFEAGDRAGAAATSMGRFGS